MGFAHSVVRDAYQTRTALTLGGEPPRPLIFIISTEDGYYLKSFSKATARIMFGRIFINDLWRMTMVGQKLCVSSFFSSIHSMGSLLRRARFCGDPSLRVPVTYVTRFSGESAYAAILDNIGIDARAACLDSYAYSQRKWRPNAAAAPKFVKDSLEIPLDAFPYAGGLAVYEPTTLLGAVRDLGLDIQTVPAREHRTAEILFEVLQERPDARVVLVVLSKATKNTKTDLLRKRGFRVFRIEYTKNSAATFSLAALDPFEQHQVVVGSGFNLDFPNWALFPPSRRPTSIVFAATPTRLSAISETVSNALYSAPALAPDATGRTFVAAYSPPTIRLVQTLDSLFKSYRFNIHTLARGYFNCVPPMRLPPSTPYFPKTFFPLYLPPDAPELARYVQDEQLQSARIALIGSAISQRSILSNAVFFSPNPLRSLLDFQNEPCRFDVDLRRFLNRTDPTIRVARGTRKPEFVFLDAFPVAQRAVRMMHVMQQFEKTRLRKSFISISSLSEIVLRPQGSVSRSFLWTRKLRGSLAESLPNTGALLVRKVILAMVTCGVLALGNKKALRKTVLTLQDGSSTTAMGGVLIKTLPVIPGPFFSAFFKPPFPSAEVCPIYVAVTYQEKKTKASANHSRLVSPLASPAHTHAEAAGKFTAAADPPSPSSSNGEADWGEAEHEEEESVEPSSVFEEYEDSDEPFIPFSEDVQTQRCQKPLPGTNTFPPLTSLRYLSFCAIPAFAPFPSGYLAPRRAAQHSPERWRAVGAINIAQKREALTNGNIDRFLLKPFAVRRTRHTPVGPCPPGLSEPPPPKRPPAGAFLALVPAHNGHEEAEAPLDVLVLPVGTTSAPVPQRDREFCRALSRALPRFPTSPLLFPGTGVNLLGKCLSFRHGEEPVLLRVDGSLFGFTELGRNRVHPYEFDVVDSETSDEPLEEPRLSNLRQNLFNVFQPFSPRCRDERDEWLGRTPFANSRAADPVAWLLLDEYSRRHARGDGGADVVARAFLERCAAVLASRRSPQPPVLLKGSALKCPVCMTAAGHKTQGPQDLILRIPPEHALELTREVRVAKEVLKNDIPICLEQQGAGLIATEVARLIQEMTPIHKSE
eukprot:gnl/Chilomastix_cuspidata/2766.p1 GENE.gnl/Chilomastix_cuspidata/2766~~gnl/Chilomastix_cuspidata/2766.p1  ORF type:complete len:1095 (+),score=430.93 gnl/Chilomastix_cuspidata/2766:714-3998(+)